MQRPLISVQNRLLSALPPEDYRLVASHLTHVDLERGRLLYEPGDRVDTVYFPHDGVISLMTLMENGAAIESATIGREGALGLMGAVAPRQSLSRAIVQTPTRAARIGASQLHEAWEKSAKIREMVDMHTEALFGHAVQSVACNALHSVEARASRWLLATHDRAGEAIIHLTQESLAEMLGVQRTTVTAVVQSLEERGLIRRHRGRVEVVDRRGLERHACECYSAVEDHFALLLPEVDL